MPGRTIDIEDLLETPNDPRFIDGIFNYCNRRCDRCAFANRCRLYADEQREEAQHPERDWKERVERSLRNTVTILNDWCARNGVAFEQLELGEPSDVAAEEERIIRDARSNPLLKQAEAYSFSAMKLAERLRHTDGVNEWPAQARDALETIEWYGLPVSSKVFRALTGRVRNLEDEGADPLQSDWNGSAKVARLNIAESRAAWNDLLRAGGAPADSPLRRMIGLLDELDAAVRAEFPNAMAFARPGFDSMPDAELGS